MTLDYFLPSYLKGSPIEEYNKKIYPPLPLPTHWNSADSDSYITIIDDTKLSLKYSGPGRNWVDAASIRSDNYIPPEVGLYYFEMTVIDSGDRGCIGIGLSKPGTRLNRMPGWEPNTIGYHGDDGHLYYERGTGRRFGPLYTTGETVGCGINYYDKEVFFTKNGINLGVASKNKFDDGMFPTCGMESPDESAMVNFGTRPFVFDINTYAKTVFAKAKQKEKEKSETVAEAVNEGADEVTEVIADTTGDIAAADTVADGNTVQQSDTVTPPVANNALDANTTPTSDNAINETTVPINDNVTDINTIQQVEVPTVNSVMGVDATPTPIDAADENAVNEIFAALTDVVPIIPDTIAEQLYEIFTGVTEATPNVVDVTASNSFDLIEEMLPPDVVTVAEDNGTTQNTIDVSLIS